jgi:hypothetical protein
MYQTRCILLIPVSICNQEDKDASSQSQYSLFILGMFTYTYERQDIIQIALKRLPGRGGIK